MSYKEVGNPFVDPYPNGWENSPSEDTPITAAALQAHTDAIANIETYVERMSKAVNYGDHSSPYILLSMPDDDTLLATIRTHLNNSILTSGTFDVSTAEKIATELAGYVMNSLVTGVSHKSKSGTASTSIIAGNTNTFYSSVYNSIISGMSNFIGTSISTGNINDSLIIGSGLNLAKSISSSIISGIGAQAIPITKDLYYSLMYGSYHDLSTYNGANLYDVMIGGTYENMSETINGKTYSPYNAHPLIVIGNGTSSTRSNALLLDSDGDLKIKGDLYTKDGKLGGSTVIENAPKYTSGYSPSTATTFSGLFGPLLSGSMFTLVDAKKGNIYQLSDVDYEFYIDEVFSTAKPSGEYNTMNDFMSGGSLSMDLVIQYLCSTDGIVSPWYRFKVLKSVKSLISKIEALETTIETLLASI